jgi:hypothetical protein
MPFNGVGVLAQAEKTLQSSAAGPNLNVDGDGCFNLQTYKDLNCSCWISGAATCTSPYQFCRTCTKVGGWIQGCSGRCLDALAVPREPSGDVHLRPSTLSPTPRFHNRPAGLSQRSRQWG